MALINPMYKLIVPEDFMTFFECPVSLRQRRYSPEAFRVAEEGYRLLEIPFVRYVDNGSLMMQLYLQYGLRLLEAEDRYKRPPPAEVVLDYLEDTVLYYNDVITTNFAEIVGNEE